MCQVKVHVTIVDSSSIQLWNTDHGKQKAMQALTDSLKRFCRFVRKLILCFSLLYIIFTLYRRLGLDYVDLYLMHSAMGGKTVETWDAMIELKEKGLTKYSH